MNKQVLWLGLPVAAITLIGAAPPATEAGTRACSTITSDAFSACRNSTQDDRDTAEGICHNLSDKAAQRSCLADARSAQQDALGECRDQRAARADVCQALGEAPYQPSFDPNDFDTDFAHPTHPNPLFPLAPGDQWTYEGGGEVDTVQIQSATKQIQGVTCVVSHDVVTVDGVVSEDTDDWIATAKSGDVFYCGEEAKQFETFPGDDPQTPELVSIDGSFKVGREGDLPGILMLASPVVGKVYRQEFSLGNAEDLAEVLSTTYKFGQDATLDQNVPQALADELCSGDCLVTRDFSPLEPGADERKYYAPGIGDFLEIALDTGTVTQLVDCNFDARCAMLPTP
ncbi:MAG TPA: hypothetical protein VEI82_09760 [Myxococcota bacterium]|nr:hypothetical protein [Myxococcota bacterium]